MSKKINENQVVVKVMDIKESERKVIFLDTVVPAIVLDKDIFEKSINSVLVVRYTDTYTSKLTKTRKARMTAVDAMNSYRDSKDSKEYKDAEKRLDDCDKKIPIYETILEDLKSKTPEYSGYTVPDDISDIVTFYSLLYSDAGALNTETGAIGTTWLSGAKQLYLDCKAFNSKYELTADAWGQERKDDFSKIKNQVVKIGSRLDGECTKNRGGFKFSCSSKMINGLLVATSTIAKHERKSNTFSDKTINSDKAFQKTLISTILRVDETAIGKSLDMTI